jgi:hypothetical protein
VAAWSGGAEESVANWIFAGKVEEVNTAEDDEEAAKQREGVDGVRGVEAAKHDE